MFVVCMLLCMVCASLAFNTQQSMKAIRMNMRMNAVTDLQEKLFNQLNDALQLKETDFTSKYGMKECSKGSHMIKTSWYDESRGSKLTGVSKYSITNSNDNSTLASVNVWMGPGYLVPHLLLTISSSMKGSDSLLTISADYVPRGPTPIGSDITYVDTYYGKSVLSWYDKYSTGNVISMPSKSFSERLLKSAIGLTVEDLSVDNATAMSTEHVDRWIQWIKDAKQLEARQRGAINTRDDKLREYAYRANIAKSIEILGNSDDTSSSLAACMTGPVAEAYVGGGG